MILIAFPDLDHVSWRLVVAVAIPPDGIVWMLGKVSFVLFLFLWFRATFRVTVMTTDASGLESIHSAVDLWVVVVGAWMQTPLWFW